MDNNMLEYLPPVRYALPLCFIASPSNKGAPQFCPSQFVDDGIIINHKERYTGHYGKL